MYACLYVFMYPVCMDGWMPGWLADVCIVCMHVCVYVYDMCVYAYV